MPVMVSMDPEDRFALEVGAHVERTLGAPSSVVRVVTHGKFVVVFYGGDDPTLRQSFQRRVHAACVEKYGEERVSLTARYGVRVNMP